MPPFAITIHGFVLAWSMSLIFDWTNQAFIQREGVQCAPKAVLRQLRRSPTPPLEHSSRPSEEHSPPPGRTRTLSWSRDSSDSTSSATKSVKDMPMVTATGWREPQSFEIFRAVERKDIVFLMEVRYVSCHLSSYYQ